MNDAPGDDADLNPLIACLDDLRELLQCISDEVGAGTVRGAELVVERRRSEVYTAMTALGTAIHQFMQTHPSPDRLEAAKALVADRVLSVSLTSPIALYSARSIRNRLSYFEVVEHVRAGRAAGADVRTRVLDDFYVHTHIGQSFVSRLALLTGRLVAAVAACEMADRRTTHVVSLQYIGGHDLLPLARDSQLLAGLQLTCIDSAAAAVRHAERTLRPAFNTHVQVMMADPVKWLQGPECSSGSVCAIYAPSLLEQLTWPQVVRVFEGVHRALAPGGFLLMGSSAGNAPLPERMLRDWLLNRPWTYRSENEWRELFAQSPFGADHVTFEYEPLAINALIHVQKSGH